MSKFKEILDQVGKDVLTEESKTVILETFEKLVSEKAEEKAQLAVSAALSQQDAEHTKKFHQLLEAIDIDHSNKFVKVVSKIDQDHKIMLERVVDKYNKELKDNALSFRDQMVDEVSNYLDMYIDKNIPMAQISEACENIQAKKMIGKIKEIVGIDEAYVNQNIKEALEDGKNTIDTLRSELNEVIKENVRLNQDLKKVNAELLIEKKTLQMDDSKKNFIMRVLKDKSPDYITENFSYVVEMFDKETQKETEVLMEEAKRSSTAQIVDTPKAISKAEPQEKTEQEPVSEYLSELKRQDR